MRTEFSGWFHGRRVLLTGHTGFCGAWLCEWLLGLGAQVHGYALEPATTPSLFDLLGLARRIDHAVGDVRDFDALSARLAQVRPEAVFHLAAQPLVLESYRAPRETWATNVMGTVNLLEALRACTSVRCCVVVTSDKCYENRESTKPYREDDALGGSDPYSASKGAAEIAVAAWRRSFARDGVPRIATARAGNVIGGGDWSPDRLVPDFVRALESGVALQLRNPSATRPWQHVLEPLGGYLHLAQRLAEASGDALAGSWNLGPADSSGISVAELASRLAAACGAPAPASSPRPAAAHEATLLRLNSARALRTLGWHCVWDAESTVSRTVGWYNRLRRGVAAQSLATEDIQAYCADARRARLPWAERP